MHKTVLFICLILVVLSALYWLSSEKIVPLPSDDMHALSGGNETCGECHSDTAEYPLSREHPPKFQCLTCHERQPSGG